MTLFLPFSLKEPEYTSISAISITGSILELSIVSIAPVEFLSSFTDCPKVNIFLLSVISPSNIFFASVLILLSDFLYSIYTVILFPNLSIAIILKSCLSSLFVFILWS